MFQSDLTPHRITKSIGDIRTSLYYPLQLQRKHLYQDFCNQNLVISRQAMVDGCVTVMQIDWLGQWYSTRRADSG